MIEWQRKREVKNKKIADEVVYSWDRQPGESERSFLAFLRYLEIGRTRNYIKVAQTTEICYSRVCKYANKYDWKARANDHDVVKEEEFRVKLDEEILQSRIRQQRIGESMQVLGECGVNMLNEHIEELSPQDVSKLIDIGVKIERLALGDATEIQDVKTESNVKVQIEEIDPEIAAKIGKMIAIESSEKMGEGE